MDTWIEFLRRHRDPVLEWLEGLGVEDTACRHRFIAGSGDSLFSSFRCLLVGEIAAFRAPRQAPALVRFDPSIGIEHGLPQTMVTV